MATAEELLATVGNEENYIVIDSDLRTMTFPASVKNIGVENDKDVHKLNFMMPRYFSEYDLSTFNIRINYLNAQGDGDMYVVTDPTVEDDAIYFSWLVGKHACLYRGAVTFIVCLKLADGEGDVAQEYNTTLASLQVLPGLETEPTILETDYDIIEQLLLTIQDTNDKIKAVLDSGLTPEEITDFVTKSKTLSARMDTFASLPDGSTTGDAELADIRVGADGARYETAGEAVRTQIAGLKSDITKIATINRSANLFNPDDPDILNNKYLNINGAVSDLSGRLVTGFMPVTPGKRLVYSRFVNGTQTLDEMSAVCFYGVDKTTVVTGGARNQNGIVVPQNAAYARVTIGNEYINNQFELSDTTEFSPYTPYGSSETVIEDDVVIPQLDNYTPKSEFNKMFSEIDELKEYVEEPLNIEYGYFNNTTLVYWQATGQSIVYFACEPYTLYTINKNITTEVFQICYIKEEPVKGVTQPIYNLSTPSSDSAVEYTTGDGALYVLILYGNNSESKENILSATSVTSKQIVLEDDVARSIITSDDAYLPKDLYMIVNKDYEIYHEQICPKAKNYTFKWNNGNNYGNRVRLNFTTTGDKTLKCDIYNADGTLARQLSSTVHVVNIASSNIYLLPLGDSLTNHCIWESELMNMANNIMCVGLRNRSVKDSDGETRTVNNEGRSGFTSFNYTTGSSYTGGTDGGGDESPNNKWYDPTGKKFSAQYYFDNNFPSGQTAPNIMTVFLGMNDLMTDKTVEQIVDNIKSMIDDIRAYNSALKIVLITPQLRYLDSLDGKEQLRFIEYANKMESLSASYSNMIFIPLLIGMDSVHNYNTNNVTINTRSMVTENRASDITHPAQEGYWQIADYILGAVSYLA